MKSPAISVVVPLFNKRDEVGATLRSVLAQTLPPVEIVVVDDGSTDGSAEVVRAIGSPLVRLLVQSNAGVCVARNRAVAEARGDYIAFLDADDCWEPGYLAEIAALIAEFPGCGIYSTAFWVLDGRGRFPVPCPAGASSTTSFATRPTATSPFLRPASYRAASSTRSAASRPV